MYMYNGSIPSGTLPDCVRITEKLTGGGMPPDPLASHAKVCYYSNPPEAEIPFHKSATELYHICPGVYYGTFECKMIN